jgi:alkaline phosphatase D
MYGSAGASPSRFEGLANYGINRSEDFGMFDLSKLQDAIRLEGSVSRRLFLAYAASLSAIPLLGRRTAGAMRPASIASDPFAVGVASGDPTASGFVLWTRLAPRPLEPGGGLAPENIEVDWQVADDESFNKVVAGGTAVASPQLAHSVHVEVDNLAPDRWYWYRFRAGDAESPVGRSRTMPAVDSDPSELRFAFASCQHYEHGLYTAYEHMARDELDLVFHLGDYIYEYAGEAGKVRKHAGKEIKSLDDYRVRHAQYKSDPLLQAMHARCPWMVTWDDHEFDNDYANDISEEAGIDPVEFLKRRANAYQAYYEMMPLRHTSLPHGPRMQLYRKATFGRLAELLVLDTRQHRTDQPTSNEVFDIELNSTTSDSTILGSEQMTWLHNSLTKSSAQWNVLAQQVMMGMVDFERGDRRRFYSDAWPAYMSERRRLIEFLHDAKINNPVVLTGDFHANLVNNLRADDRKPELPVVATEFVGTSISSSGNGEDKREEWNSLMAENACLRFLNDQRGYVRCTVTPDAWRSEFRVVESVTEPGAPIKTRATFAIEAGKPGAVEA